MYRINRMYPQAHHPPTTRSTRGARSDPSADALSVWQTQLVNAIDWAHASSPFPLLRSPPDARTWNKIKSLAYKPPSGSRLNAAAIEYLTAFATSLAPSVLTSTDPIRVVKRVTRPHLDVRFVVQHSQKVTRQIDDAWSTPTVDKVVGRLVWTDLDERPQGEALWIVHKSFRDVKEVVEIYHPTVRAWWKTNVAQAVQEKVVPLFQEWFDGAVNTGFFAGVKAPKGLAQHYPFFAFLLPSRAEGTYLTLWNLFLACDRLRKAYSLDDAVRLLTQWDSLDEDLQRELYRDFSLFYLSFIAFTHQITRQR